MTDTWELEIPDEPEIKKQNTEPDGTRRELDNMPCDHGFWTSEDTYEICHATGYEESHGGEWWNEYVDRDGGFHYGR